MKILSAVLVILFLSSTSSFAISVKERLKKAREQEKQEVSGEEQKMSGGEQKTTEKYQTYKDGKPWFIQKYANGKKHGTATWFHKNGEVSDILQYKEGRLLDDNGNLYTGIRTTVYENGKKSGEWPFKDGLEEGTAKVYNREGILVEEQTFRNGKFIKRKVVNSDAKPLDF